MQLSSAPLESKLATHPFPVPATASAPANADASERAGRFADALSTAAAGLKPGVAAHRASGRLAVGASASVHHRTFVPGPRVESPSAAEREKSAATGHAAAEKSQDCKTPSPRRRPAGSPDAARSAAPDALALAANSIYVQDPRRDAPPPEGGSELPSSAGDAAQAGELNLGAMDESGSAAGRKSGSPPDTGEADLVASPSQSAPSNGLALSAGTAMSASAATVRPANGGPDLAGPTHSLRRRRFQAPSWPQSVPRTSRSQPRPWRKWPALRPQGPSPAWQRRPAGKCRRRSGGGRRRNICRNARGEFDPDRFVEKA
jgi:hypothetical protein